MFGKSKISKSMIDAVNSVIGEEPVVENKKPAMLSEEIYDFNIDPHTGKMKPVKDLLVSGYERPVGKKQIVMIEEEPNITPETLKGQILKKKDDKKAALGKPAIAMSAEETELDEEGNCVTPMKAKKIADKEVGKHEKEMHKEGKSFKERLLEKSTSEKQARTMAAAAHNPKFAKKVGIPQSVAKDFNKADKGTKMLSKAMSEETKSIDDKIKEREAMNAKALKDRNEKILKTPAPAKPEKHSEYFGKEASDMIHQSRVHYHHAQQALARGDHDEHKKLEKLSSKTHENAMKKAEAYRKDPKNAEALKRAGEKIQSGAANDYGKGRYMGDSVEVTGTTLEEVTLDEKDELRSRIGTNIVNKKPREGQTDLRNIPSGNRPDSKNKFSQGERDSQPSRLKSAIKSSLGKHTKPNLPEEMEVTESLKDVAKKILSKVGHPDDKGMRKDLQKKVGVPQTGEKPKNEEVELDEEQLDELSTHALNSYLHKGVSKFKQNAATMSPAEKQKKVAHLQKAHSKLKAKGGKFEEFEYGMNEEEEVELDEGTMTHITLGKKVKNKEGGHNQDVHHKGKKIGLISSYSHRTGTRYGMHHDATGDMTAGSRSAEDAIADLRQAHAEHLQDTKVKKEEVELDENAFTDYKTDKKPSIFAPKSHTPKKTSTGTVYTKNWSKKDMEHKDDEKVKKEAVDKEADKHVRVDGETDMNTKTVDGLRGRMKVPADYHNKSKSYKVALTVGEETEHDDEAEDKALVKKMVKKDALKKTDEAFKGPEAGSGVGDHPFVTAEAKPLKNARELAKKTMNRLKNEMLGKIAN